MTVKEKKSSNWINNYCLLKTPLRKWKGQATDWEEIFAICISDEDLQNMLKLQTAKKKRAGNPIEKWLGQALQKREYPNGQ